MIVTRTAEVPTAVRSRHATPALLAGALAALVLAVACSGSSGPTAPTPTGMVSTPGQPAPSPTPPAPTPPPTPPTPPPAPQSARYRVTFDALWSQTTHPQDFPASPHFSPLVGGTHTAAVRFWQDGGPATDGIRNMAERGSVSPLDSEVRAAITAGTAQFLLRGGDIPRSPASTSFEFDITQSHALVTLVSMIAPSPDWFVGVSALPLFENGQWTDRRVVDLGPWDAGTDSGRTFESPDEETRPRQPISRITGFPFAVNGAVAPMGRYTFERLP